MRKIILISKVWFLCIVFAVWGCMDSFLGKKPLGVLTEAAFMQTESDAIQATNACYNILRDWFYHSGGFPILDIISDDAHKGSNPGDQAGTVGQFDNFTFDANSGDISRWYTTLYKGIRRTNVVVELIKPIAMEQNLKNRLIGEARFLRAMFYFDLVRAFGDVPMVLGLNPERRIKRTPANIIYEQVIIPDLLFAAENLPITYTQSDKGRATRGAAKALLAKVYLYRKDFLNAEKFALEVINSGVYGLESDFSKVFSKQGEYGSESVFEIGAVGVESADLGGNQYANTQGVRGTPNRGWGFNRPSLDLIASFEPNDPRLQATVIFLGETLDGIKIFGDGGTPDSTFSADRSKLLEIETYNQKVWVPGNTPVEQWDYNKRVIRYAEVLLIASEASNENNKTSQALQFLNQIRQRVGLNNITETDKDKLRDLIMNERRHELALEEQRFYDLLRTGKAQQVLGKLGFQPKHALFPIPQSEIDLTEGSLTQNPGW